MITENKMLGFIKSNQLINIDRNGISATMIECMDKMLQIPQIEIKKSKDNNIPVERLLNNRYKISVGCILGKHTRGNLPFIREQVESISKMDIKCIDRNYNFGIINIFQNLKHIVDEDVFEYTLNNDISISFYNGNNIIGEPESNPYFSDMSYKYKLDLDLKMTNHIICWNIILHL